jgi:predicted TIM-barrel fold metal-dependent hydrolase
VIVDCHTHWGMVWEDRDQGDPSNWLKVLDQYGVDKAFLLGHYNLHRCDLAAEDNTRLADITRQAKDRFIPFGSVWPQMGKDAVSEARRCLEDLGMKGLKFHPWLQGFSTGDAVLGEICGIAGELNAPILFHDGTPCYSLPEQVAGLARRFPGTRFVLGHAGLLWSWRSALEALRVPNVWACLCGPHQRAIEILAREASSERLLWGTDFGFGFSDPIDYRLNLFLSAAIDEALKKRILGENPFRLFDF